MGCHYSPGSTETNSFFFILLSSPTFLSLGRQNWARGQHQANNKVRNQDYGASFRGERFFLRSVFVTESDARRTVTGLRNGPPDQENGVTTLQHSRRLSAFVPIAGLSLLSRDGEGNTGPGTEHCRASREEDRRLRGCLYRCCC